MQIKLAGMVSDSIADGPGIRLAVFVQGCPHHCPGCHNPDTHDPAGGYWANTEEIIAALQKPYLRGITLSGGEPLAQPEASATLAQAATANQKDVIVYTGYTWEEIQRMACQSPALQQLLHYTWLLIDGPFMLQHKNLALPFRGSENQRVIDVAKSLVANSCILYEF